MLVSVDLDRYARWAAKTYAETTAAQRVSDARSVVRAIEAGERPIPRYHFTGVSLQRWAQEEGVDLTSLEPALSELTDGDTRAEAVSATKRRKKPAVSFSPHDWRALAIAIINDDSPEARIEELVLLTGLRIGDVLRIERAQFERAVATGALEVPVKGGRVREVYVEGAVLEGFERLWRTMQATPEGRAFEGPLHEWIAPGSRDARPYFAAYQRVRRHLLRLTEGLGLSGSVHLHRMRRTIAMEAYRASGADIVAVQQMLGHQNVATTQKYIDEERPADVASLREKIHQNLLGK